MTGKLTTDSLATGPVPQIFSEREGSAGLGIGYRAIAGLVPTVGTGPYVAEYLPGSADPVIQCPSHECITSVIQRQSYDCITASAEVIPDDFGSADLGVTHNSEIGKTDNRLDASTDLVIVTYSDFGKSYNQPTASADPGHLLTMVNSDHKAPVVTNSSYRESDHGSAGVSHSAMNEGVTKLATPAVANGVTNASADLGDFGNLAENAKLSADPVIDCRSCEAITKVIDGQGQAAITGSADLVTSCYRATIGTIGNSSKVPCLATNTHRGISIKRALPKLLNFPTTGWGSYPRRCRASLHPCSRLAKGATCTPRQLRRRGARWKLSTAMIITGPAVLGLVGNLRRAVPGS